MNRPPLITSIKDQEIRLAEIGKIKIGGKGEERTAKSGKKYRVPDKYDHFVITTLERDGGGKGNLIPDAEIMAELGPEPKELDVILLHDDPDMNLQSKYSLYIGAMQWCVGDGERGYRRNRDDHAKGIESWGEMTCPCAHWKAEKQPCKKTLVLSVMLLKSPKIGGVYKFRSTSEISLTNLRSAMTFILSLTGGILAGIPLKLIVQPQTVTPKGIVTKVYVANLVYAGVVTNLLGIATETAKRRAEGFQQNRQLRAQIDKLLLAPPLSETDEDICDEFYPEGEGAIEGELVDDKEQSSTTPAVDYPKADEQQEEEPQEEEQQEEQPPPPAEPPDVADSVDSPDAEELRMSGVQRLAIFAIGQKLWDYHSGDALKDCIKQWLARRMSKLGSDFSLSESKENALTFSQAEEAIAEMRSHYEISRGKSMEPPQGGVGPPPAETAEQAGEASSRSSGPEQASSPEPSNRDPEPPPGGDGEETAEQAPPPTGSPAPPDPPDPPDPKKDALLEWLADALSGKIATVAQGSANILLKAFLSTYSYPTLSSASADELKQFKDGLIKNASPVPPSNPSKSTRSSRQESSPKAEEDLF